jgi:hypothetical protein
MALIVGQMVANIVAIGSTEIQKAKALGRTVKSSIMATGLRENDMEKELLLARRMEEFCLMEFSKMISQ